MKNIFKIFLLLVIFLPTSLSAYSYGTEVSPSPNYGGCSGYWDGYNCLPPNVPYQCERGYVEYRGEHVSAFSSSSQTTRSDEIGTSRIFTSLSSGYVVLI